MEQVDHGTATIITATRDLGKARPVATVNCANECVSVRKVRVRANTLS